MTEESKEVDPTIDAEVIEETLVRAEQTNEGLSNEDGDEEDVPEGETEEAVAAGSSAKKKKSKKAKIKKALGMVKQEDGAPSGSSSSANPASKLTTEMVEQLLEMNPSLKGEVAGMDKEKAAEALKKLDVADLLTGMVWTSFWKRQWVDGYAVGEREESKRHGFIQVLANTAGSPLRSVSSRDESCE